MLSEAMTNENFSMVRFSLLVKNSVMQGYRSLLTISAAIALLIIFTGLIFSQLSGDFYNAWFTLLLFGWGILLSSRAFKPLHDKTCNEAYLLIPASSLEKVLSALLITTLGFILFVLTFISLVSLVVSLLQVVLGQSASAVFNPLSEGVWRFIGIYISIQAFYFLGAVWFRSFHIAKTILSLGVISIGFTLIAMFVFTTFFGSYFADDVDTREALYVLWNLSQGRLTFLHYAFDLLLPIACWCIAWLRFREVQVSEGV